MQTTHDDDVQDRSSTETRRTDFSVFTFALATWALIAAMITLAPRPTVVASSATGASSLLSEISAAYPNLTMPASVTTNVLRVVTTSSTSYAADSNLVTYGSLIDAIAAYNCGDVIVVDEGSWGGGSLDKNAVGTAATGPVLIEEAAYRNAIRWLRAGRSSNTTCANSVGFGLTIVARYPAVAALTNTELGLNSSPSAASPEFSGNATACTGFGNGGASPEANVGKHAIVHGIYVGVDGRFTIGGVVSTTSVFEKTQVAGLEFTSVETTTSAFGTSCALTAIPYGTGIDLKGASCPNCRFVQNQFRDLSAIVTSAGNVVGAKGVHVSEADGALIGNNRLVRFRHASMNYCGFQERAYGVQLGSTSSDIPESQTMEQLGIQVEYSSNVVVARNTVVGNYNWDGASTNDGTNIAYPAARGKSACKKNMPYDTTNQRFGSDVCPSVSGSYFYEDTFNAIEFTHQVCRSAVYCNVMLGSGKGALDIKNSSWNGKSTVDATSCSASSHIVANTATQNSSGVNVHEGSSHGAFASNYWHCNSGSGLALRTWGANCDVSATDHQGDIHDWAITGDAAHCNGDYGFALTTASVNTTITTPTETLSRNVGTSCLLNSLSSGALSASTSVSPALSYQFWEDGTASYASVGTQWYRNLYDVTGTNIFAVGNGNVDVHAGYLSATRTTYLNDQGVIGSPKSICTLGIGAACATISGSWGTASHQTSDYIATAISSGSTVAGIQYGTASRGTASTLKLAAPTESNACTRVQTMCDTLRTSFGSW